MEKSRFIQRYARGAATAYINARDSNHQYQFPLNFRDLTIPSAVHIQTITPYTEASAKVTKNSKADMSQGGYLVGQFAHSEHSL